MIYKTLSGLKGLNKVQYALMERYRQLLLNEKFIQRTDPNATLLLLNENSSLEQIQDSQANKKESNSKGNCGVFRIM